MAKAHNVSANVFIPQSSSDCETAIAAPVRTKFDASRFRKCSLSTRVSGAVPFTTAAASSAVNALHLRRDVHRAELRAAHRAEVRVLEAFLGQRLVVHRRAPSPDRATARTACSSRSVYRARDSSSSRSRAPGRFRAMSAACAAILYAMIPAFTSSRFGSPRCSFGVT